jgi:hypothetical protein
MPRPAVLIDTVPPPTPDVLPRMDVAAFVGLADAGPVDVPVAIEDIAQFRDIFGAEPTLAYDAESSEPQLGYLDVAVETFFGTGGRRCWVVRVADEPGTQQFRLAGLAVPPETAGPLDPNPILVNARSPGIGFAGSVAHTTLIETPLLSAGDSSVPILQPAVDTTGAALDLLLAAGAVAVTPGTLLRLTAAASDLRLFVVAEDVHAAGGATRVRSHEWLLARAFESSPPQDSALRSEQLAILDSALLDLTPSSPWFTTAPRIDALNFEISIWRDRAIESRIAALEFSPRHPRYFRNLPDDDALYFVERARRADRRDAELLALWDEARGNRRDTASQATRRFAIGFAAGEQALYLPNGMSRLRHPDFDSLALPKLAARSGNERLVASMFVDARLQDGGGDALRRAAEGLHAAARDWARSRRGPTVNRLRGIHALLPVDEVTLAAVPDLIHRGWSVAASEPKGLLAAPSLLDARVSTGGSELLAEWTSVPQATSYLLQVSGTADFSQVAAEQSFDAVESSLGTVTEHLARPESCGGLLYVRVGARRRGEPSPWSNTRFVLDGSGAFERCERLAVERLLQAQVVSPNDDARLQWGSDEPLALDFEFEVQSAGDALFVGAPSSERTRLRQVLLPATGDGTRYYRVRAVNTTMVGPWSNTIVWTPRTLSRPVLDPKPRAATSTAAGRGYDDSLLLDVHRALLRFCEARGDLVALLSLPRHYGPLDVADYLAAMIPASEFVAPAPARGRRPLTLGETAVLSYGALFYPWLAHRVDVDRGVRRPRFAPSDGIAAAALAQVAIERGAWIPAANRPLPGVLSLEPRLADAYIDLLHDRQVNVLVRAATGFLFVDAETLSRDTDTRSLSVRRLLILLKRMAYREGVSLVFEPHDVDLQERVYTDFERVLSKLHQLGAFKGANADEAFAVIADASINPQSSVDAGRFIVELRIAPSEPLKFLRVRLTQSGPQSLNVGEL